MHYVAQSARRPRKTKRSPACGSRPRPSCTCNARLFMPRRMSRRQPHPHPRWHRIMRAPVPPAPERAPPRRRPIHQHSISVRRDDLDPARRRRCGRGGFLDHHRRHKPGGHRTDQCAGPVRLAPGEQQRARDPVAPRRRRGLAPTGKALLDDLQLRLGRPTTAPAEFDHLEPLNLRTVLMPIHKDTPHRPARYRKTAFTGGLRIDEDVLAWFRAQGPGYQTRMNAVLRAYVDAQKRGGR
jgi:uncharacterized protein (DUF4415 family)